MAIETKSPETASGDQSVTTDDLLKAADAAETELRVEQKPEPNSVITEEIKEPVSKTNETKSEEVKVDETKKEEVKQDENAERSKLGRKVKYLEESLIPRLESKIDLLLAQKSPGKTEDDEFIPPQTQEEFERKVAEFEDKKVSRIQNNQLKYQAGFLSALSRIGLEEDGSIYEEVVNEIKKEGSKFNVCYSSDYTSDPNVDAERNYIKAKNFILSQKLKSVTVSKEPVNPLKGDKPKVPFGVSGTTKVAPKSEPELEMDEYARDFVRRTKMSDEDVKVALTGPEKTYQKR